MYLKWSVFCSWSRPPDSFLGKSMHYTSPVFPKTYMGTNYPSSLRKSRKQTRKQDQTKTWRRNSSIKLKRWWELFSVLQKIGLDRYRLCVSKFVNPPQLISPLHTGSLTGFGHRSIPQAPLPTPIFLTTIQVHPSMFMTESSANIHPYLMFL